MKILCAVASKHGSTREVGELIVSELQAQGLDAQCQTAAAVESLDGFDIVILGSAVYMAQWAEDARKFVSRFDQELRSLPVWAFSVGLSGLPSGEIKDPSRVGPVLLTLDPVDYRTFPGKLDPMQLNLRERSIVRMGGAAEGDFRDFDEIREWARSIAEGIKERQAEES